MAREDGGATAPDRLLCVGFYPYDVEHLLPVARRLRDETGLGADFVSVAPPTVAVDVQEIVAAEGFGALDRPLIAPDDRSIRNPVQRFRGQRRRTEALINELLEEVRPRAILASVNPPPGLFLDETARRGIPTVLLQLFTWGDRSFYKEWRRDEWRLQDRNTRWRGRLRRHVERRVAAHYRVGPHIPWDVRHATIALQGKALRDRLVAEGVSERVLEVTGNPSLDDIYRVRESRDQIRSSMRRQLGLPQEATLVTHLRSYEDRLFTVDKRSHNQAQVNIMQAVRQAAPHAHLVVKVHPREGDVVKDHVRSIDPRAILTGQEVGTNELIAASDLVVSTASTTLLHSVILDRPTVSAWFWPGLAYFRRVTDAPAVERVDTPRALVASIRSHLQDERHRASWHKRRMEFVEREYVLDGRGTERVAALLKKLTRDESVPISTRR